MGWNERGEGSPRSGPTPLEEHLAWIFEHRGWRNAIRSEERVTNEDAPIMLWYRRHFAERQIQKELTGDRRSAAATRHRRSKVKAR